MSIKEAKVAVKPYYLDEYIVEEDELGDSGPQDTLIHYLKNVLQYYFRREQWLIMANRNHYHYAVDNSKNLIVPDISVAKDIPIPPEDQPYIVSWDMRHDRGNRPPPPLVFEIASKETYKGDIEPDKKPRLYGLIGVKEYFCYDPNEPPIFAQITGRRLLGWRYDDNRQPHEILPDEYGRLWSEVLEGYLKEDKLYLRLYDRHGILQLPGWESEEAARIKEEAARGREEARRKEAELRAQAEAGARIKEEAARKEAELRARTEAETRRREEAARKEAELRLQAEAEARREIERQLEELKRQLENRPDQT